MWVPVRPSVSRRKSTSSVRASICPSNRLPLTVTAIATRSAPAESDFDATSMGNSFTSSGINVSPFDRLAPAAPQRNLYRAPRQRAHQRPLVIHRAAHVGLRIGGSHAGLGGAGDGLRIHFHAREFLLGRGSSYRSQADASQNDARFA